MNFKKTYILSSLFLISFQATPGHSPVKLSKKHTKRKQATPHYQITNLSSAITYLFFFLLLFAPSSAMVRPMEECIKIRDLINNDRQYYQDVREYAQRHREDFGHVDFPEVPEIQCSENGKVSIYVGDERKYYRPEEYEAKKGQKFLDTFAESHHELNRRTMEYDKKLSEQLTELTEEIQGTQLIVYTLMNDKDKPDLSGFSPEVQEMIRESEIQSEEVTELIRSLFPNLARSAFSSPKTVGANVKTSGADFSGQYQAKTRDELLNWKPNYDFQSHDRFAGPGFSGSVPKTRGELINWKPDYDFRLHDKFNRIDWKSEDYSRAMFNGDTPPPRQFGGNALDTYARSSFSYSPTDNQKK